MLVVAVVLIIGCGAIIATPALVKYETGHSTEIKNYSLKDKRKD